MIQSFTFHPKILFFFFFPDSLENLAKEFIVMAQKRYRLYSQSQKKHVLSSEGLLPHGKGERIIFAGAYECTSETHERRRWPMRKLHVCRQRRPLLHCCILWVALVPDAILLSAEPAAAGGGSLWRGPWWAVLSEPEFTFSSSSCTTPSRSRRTTFRTNMKSPP